MRGRGAAAHPRRGHRRQADPRQALPGRLGAPRGAQPLAARQRGHLGHDAHRPAREPRARGDAGLRRVVRTPRRARRRAGRAHGPAPGHEAHGRAVRDGAHDRGGPGAQPRGRPRALSAFVRHAGRGGLHRGRCRTLPRGLRAGDRRHRGARERARAGRHSVRAPRNLHQALGAAPALRVRAARARARRTRPAGPGARRARARRWRGNDPRRRGGRPARPFPRYPRARLRLRAARRLGGLRLGGAGLPVSRAVRYRLARRAGAPPPPPPRGAPREGRVLGHRGEARAGAGPVGLPGVHAQVQHRRVLPRVRAAHAGGARRVLRPVRDPQRAHDRDHPRPRRRLPGIRVPAPARDGRGPLRRGARRRPRLPRLRAGRKPRGPAALSRAPAARERRQHLVRQPHRRPRDRHRGGDRRSRGARRLPGAGGQSEDPVARGALRGPAQFGRARLRRRVRLGIAARRARAAAAARGPAGGSHRVGRGRNARSGARGARSVERARHRTGRGSRRGAGAHGPRGREPCVGSRPRRSARRSWSARPT